MPTREEMIAALSGGQNPAAPSREQMIAALSGGQKPPMPSTEPQQKTNIAEAALQGFGQGGTLGYLPEMQAGVETGLNKILPESMGGQDPMLDYQKSLQQWRAQNDTLKEEHPIATTGGNVAGALMTLPMGGTVGQGARALKAAQAVGFGKNALTAAKIGQAAAVGAGYGALANTENPEGDYLDLKQRLGNAGTGALFGAGGESLALGGSSFLKHAGEKLKNSAIVKQIGANAGQIKTILKKDQLPELGKFMKDEGLLGVGKNTEDVAVATKKIIEDDGPKIAGMYREAQEKSMGLGDVPGIQMRPGTPATTKSVPTGLLDEFGNSFDKQITIPGKPAQPAALIQPNSLADDILKSTKERVKNHANRDQVISEMESALKPLRDMGDNANLMDLHAYRKSLDENVTWAKTSRERDAVQNAYVNARNMVADRIENTMGALDKALPGDELVKNLKQLNKRFSNASTVNTSSTQAVGREMSKVLMGGTINSIGGGIAAQGEYSRSHDPLNTAGAFILGSLATGAARKAAVPVSFQSGRLAGTLGRGLEKVGNKAGMVGGAAAAAESPWMSMNKKPKDKSK